MGSIVEHGPSVGEYLGRTIPAFIVEDTGRRSEYVGIAVATDGGVDLSQLAKDECVIAPGLIYRVCDQTGMSEKLRKE